MVTIARFDMGTLWGCETYMLPLCHPTSQLKRSECSYRSRNTPAPRERCSTDNRTSVCDRWRAHKSSYPDEENERCHNHGQARNELKLMGTSGGGGGGGTNRAIL